MQLIGRSKIDGLKSLVTVARASIGFTLAFTSDVTADPAKDKAAQTNVIPSDSGWLGLE
jgi:hypothetical protein